MDLGAIASLLEPYASGLTGAQLRQVSAHLELLRKWNARTNLTSVRAEEDIVTRHVGESLFAARVVLGAPSKPVVGLGGTDLIDVGSGAGFPGLPMKIYDPALRLILVESQNKKATFLKEVVRALELHDVQVFSGRAEELGRTADLVTVRAVERFADMLPVAASLVAPSGRLALLIGEAQIKEAHRILPALAWGEAIAIPGSSRRVLLVGKHP